MSPDEYFNNLNAQATESTILEVHRARKKAAADFSDNTRDFINPGIETNPYTRESEAHMREAYNEERLLLIEEWMRNNGH